MVVVVEVVVNLLVDYGVLAVVLVDGVYYPALDTVDLIVGGALVPLALEAGVLEQILDHVAILDSPLGLVAVVGGAQVGHEETVAVYIHAAVGGHGIAVGVVLAVGVVEYLLAAVARGGGVFDVDFRLTVVQTDGVGLHIGLEGSAVFGHGICVEGRCILLGLHTELHGVAVLAGGEAVGCGGGKAVAGACKGGIGLDVLTLQVVGIAGDIDVGAGVAAAQDYLA